MPLQSTPPQPYPNMQDDDLILNVTDHHEMVDRLLAMDAPRFNKFVHTVTACRRALDEAMPYREGRNLMVTGFDTWINKQNAT